MRVVKVLGLDVPLELYKETQRIEADGGMMIKVRKYFKLFQTFKTNLYDRMEDADVLQAVFFYFS